MEFTIEESSRLRQVWTERSQLCRFVRAQERSAHTQRLRQMMTAISVTLCVIFGLSAWIVSRILPFDLPTAQTKVVVVDEEQWAPDPPPHQVLQALQEEEPLDLSNTVSANP